MRYLPAGQAKRNLDVVLIYVFFDVINVIFVFLESGSIFTIFVSWSGIVNERPFLKMDTQNVPYSSLL
jgi:hypothetical protein